MRFICYIFLLLAGSFILSTNHDEEDPDYYQVLGVERSASLKEIRRLYKINALRWHPDKNKGKEEEAHKRWLLISEAHEVLKDPQLRNEYDSQNEPNALMHVFSRCCAGSMSLFNIFSCRK